MRATKFDLIPDTDRFAKSDLGHERTALRDCSEGRTKNVHTSALLSRARVGDGFGDQLNLTYSAVLQPASKQSSEGNVHGLPLGRRPCEAKGRGCASYRTFDLLVRRPAGDWKRVTRHDEAAYLNFTAPLNPDLAGTSATTARARLAPVVP
jgi:hypothetical protein